jgi:DNA (cytosine-5)-methyltransferase 1
MADFYEFFAGGGMVRAGLGAGWTCRFANDFDAMKALSYQANWGTGGELFVGDVASVEASALPGHADLMWGSFPCQDLSLAGAGKGLSGHRSGAFHAFWRVVQGLAADGRAPAVVAIENVCGALTSNGGRDFAVLMQTFAEGGYRPGALVIDAELFTPQSRPRLFVIGVHDSVALPSDLTLPAPLAPFYSRAVVKAVEALPAAVRDRTVWWSLPLPPRRASVFADLVETAPNDVAWHDPSDTDRLLALMSPLNRAKVDQARRAGRRMVGTIYRRTRTENGQKVQRAEVRFDDIAGCLRTPGGGSSRQILLVVEGERIRSRLISPRETARLMGLADSYVLPRSYSAACHLTGDGVAAPVVRHLARHLFEPITEASTSALRQAV